MIITNELRNTCKKVDDVERLMSFIRDRYIFDARKTHLLDKVAKKYEIIDGYTLFIDGEINRGQYVRLLYAHRLRCFGDGSYNYFIFGKSLNDTKTNLI